AEDGIRDFHVTGVQTCALPIFHRHQVVGNTHCCILLDGLLRCLPLATCPLSWRKRVTYPPPFALLFRPPCRRSIDGQVASLVPRSEERRVGKECTAWGWERK